MVRVQSFFFVLLNVSLASAANGFFTYPFCCCNRYFPYFITVGSVAILFMGFIFWLIATRRLLPAIVMIGAFMLFVLWLVGLVIVSVQLWGPSGSIQSTCNLQVFNRSPHGLNQETLAWMQQKNICELNSPVCYIYVYVYMYRRFPAAAPSLIGHTGQCWHLVFAMSLTGIVFLVWVMIMAYQVFVNS